MQWIIGNACVLPIAFTLSMPHSFMALKKHTQAIRIYMPATKCVAIIGAGPAGLMAAEILATAGMQVMIYDRMPSAGRKLLMAGRGGLNLTHSEPLEQFLTRYGRASDWLAPYIEAFPPQALVQWCEGLGVETFTGSSGRIFPRSMKAAPLLRAWLGRLNALGVQFFPRHEWRGWEGDTLCFADANGNMVRATPDATLLALGGASWPRLGSNGSWRDILAACNVAISPFKPANCGFTVNWSEYFSSNFAGKPLKPVSISLRNQSQQGEAMITASGIESGVIYALSSYLRDAIEKNGSTEIYLDLRPGMTAEALAEKLKNARGNKSFSTYLRKSGFSPLAIALLREVTPADMLTNLPPAALAARIKSLPVTLTGTTGIERAISTAGGIAREALSEDLMLRAKTGVFAAGEMLDWEAPTGGYLLQACFSTAVAAAEGMLKYINQHDAG